MAGAPAARRSILGVHGRRAAERRSVRQRRTTIVVNFVVTDPAEEFRRHLLAELPELEPRIERARQELHRPSSVYWYLSYVLRPFTTELLAANDEARLRRVWAFWESLAADNLHSDRDQLWSAIEEFDLPEIAPWLGPQLRALISEHMSGAA